MKRNKALLAVASFALAVSTAGVASANPWSVGAGAGANFTHGGEELKHGLHVQGRAGVDLSDKVTAELVVGGNPGQKTRAPLEGKVNSTRLGADVLYHLDSSTADFDPFLAVGAGNVRYNTRIAGKKNDPFIGAGFGFKSFVAEDVYLRGDYRFNAVRTQEFTQDALLSVGYQDRNGGNGDDLVEQGNGMSDDELARHRGNLKPVYFDFDRSNVRGEAVDTIKTNIKYLGDNSLKTVLEGNCDERGTEEYNMALGAARSQAVYDYMKTAGYSAENMSTVSYGESRPANPGHNEAAWQENRRVDFEPVK